MDFLSKKDGPGSVISADNITKGVIQVHRSIVATGAPACFPGVHAFSANAWAFSSPLQLSSPLLPVEATVLDGLGKVFRLYVFRAGEVGNGAGYLEDTIIRTRG